MKKRLAVFTVLALLTGLMAPAALAGEAVTVSTLLNDLLSAYDSARKVETDVAALDDDVAQAVAEHWRRVYLDPDYRLYVYGQDDPAELPVSGAHAFVVLGYELLNGEMTEELMGRCDAAAAAAEAFPDSIIVCSGGATGPNNPEKHTEAGLMKDYLAARGIAPERVFTDEKAMSTSENAINTLAILRGQGIETMTLVTSTYHQRWGQVLYNALAAQYRRDYGYSAEIVGNFCFDIAPSNPLFAMDAQIALMQLGRILQIPRADRPAVDKEALLAQLLAACGTAEELAELRERIDQEIEARGR